MSQIIKKFFKAIKNYFDLNHNLRYKDTITLSRKDYDFLVQTLKNPPPINEKLKELLKKYE